MNILVFSWRDIKHPNAGGAEQVIHEHAKSWVDAGHKVTHFSSKMKGLSNFETIDKIDFIRSGYQYLGVQMAGFFYYLKNRSKIDLVVDEFHGVPFFTPLYIKKPRLAILQEVAKEVWFLNPLPRPLNWIVGLIGYLGEPLVFLFYRNTKFMTGSASAKNDILKMSIPLKNITIVPHGVILGKKIKNKKAKIKTLVYLGVLSKDKGIEDAIKCFKLLDDYSIQFWIIGRPETPAFGSYIESQIKKLKFKGEIKFWGFVSQDKKFELLSKAHLLINPSVHEGWGLVNIEANSVGTPVVSYNNAGLIDSVKPEVSGLICKENTPESMAKIIINLLNDEKKYNKLQKGAINWSKNFTWEKSKKLSLELINEL